MKIQTSNRSGGFTLIEMVGVLAIIAILSALLVPRIFSAINESRINGAIVSINSAKSAAVAYYGKYGKFGGYGGADLTTTNADWDLVLLQEELLEKPFETKISNLSSTNAHQIQLVAGLSATTAATDVNAAYNLDNNSTSPNPANDASGKWVVQAYIQGVNIDDAIELNNRIDGDLDPVQKGSTSANTLGRVKYTAPASDNTVDVRVYLAHK
ncbi:MAG: type II secretion system protein [Verrucomicrobiia bacterium]